jgi:DNA-binding IclR family transcriptional regulator
MHGTGMSSLDKMLGILGLFREGRAGVALDDVMALTQVSRATAYRYLQSLTEAGLLAPATGGAYGLGARVVELDRLMRKTDPLLIHSAVPARQLAAELHANVLLCSYYGDKVMCVDIVWPNETVPQAYERGRPMPMFRGAMAKTILAHLSPYHLRNIQAWHADEIREAGLGETWQQFRANMAALRNAEVVITRAEVVEGLVGLGAPILNGEGRILGSLVLAIPTDRYEASSPAPFVASLRETADRINAAIADGASAGGQHLPRPLRPRKGKRSASEARP